MAMKTVCPSSRSGDVHILYNGQSDVFFQSV